MRRNPFSWVIPLFAVFMVFCVIGLFFNLIAAFWAFLIHIIFTYWEYIIFALVIYGIFWINKKTSE